MKIEIVSKEMVKPASPAPFHHGSYTLSLLDQLAPPFYIPVVLFYSAPELGRDLGTLKKSLSETLCSFYPLAGRVKGDGASSVDLTGDGVLFIRAQARAMLQDLLENPQLNLINHLLPLDPYGVKSSDGANPVTVIQVNEFECGAVAIGVCVSHRVADGATLSCFLSSWASVSRGQSWKIEPRLDMATVFPPQDFQLLMPSNVIRKEKIVTKRFVFEPLSLASLRAKVGKQNSSIRKPTLVEAVTALISRSAMDAKTEASDNSHSSSTIITHVVNLRGRSIPLLPDHSFGNIWRFAIAPIREGASRVELPDMVVLIQQAITKVDDNYVRKLQGEDGFYQAWGSLREVSELMYKGGLESYRFSSWVRFPFYETDFGWGKLTWACISSIPIKNVVILMGTRSGDGMEAWVTLHEQEMAKFESNPLLLQFAVKDPRIL